MDRCYKILVVDDNKAILRIYKSALTHSSQKTKHNSYAENDISLIEDTETSRQYSGISFDPVFCAQAESAVQTVKKSLEDGEPFSVVFMDLEMPPGQDGIWAAKHIREMDEHIEIVIVTGHTHKSPVSIAAEIKPLHKLLYLEKPLHIWEITQFAAALSKKWENEIEVEALKTDLKKKVFQQTVKIANTNKKLSNEIEIRKQAQESLRLSVNNLRQAFGGIVQVITSMIEARDPYTAGHQCRVADLARSIATEMSLPGKSIEGIRIAATVHDLGKISIPSDILNKPGKLSDVEILLIKNHVQTGYDLLKNISFPWPIADIIYQHHEKLDGSGYPNHLSGEEILMEARILTVADVVEAMKHRRPYRSALGIKLAMMEIYKNRGKIYDPQVVDICIRLFKERKFAFKD